MRVPLTSLQGQEIWPNDDDLSGRSSEGLHQEDHEPAEPVDAEVQDFEVGAGGYE